MTHIKKASLFLIVLALGFMTYIVPASANPLQTAPTTQTSTATTSPAYMTAGNATSTLLFDSYGSGTPKISDQATLLIQFSASSTVSVLNTNLEYSQDGIDWYQDGGVMENNFATTTKPFSITQVNQFSLQFASSTAGLPANKLTDSTTTRAIFVRTPTRFVRAVFTLPVGSTPGGVWAQWLASRQVSE